MALDNDTRGWILTVMSAVACIFGSLVICVDVLIRKLPGKRNFKIEENDSFLSSSLSLSFGVMLFSSLNNMLPSAKDSLQKGGFSSKAASFTLIACFFGGAAGIQIISHLFHRFLPSHVVDCDHTHDDEDPEPQPTHKRDDGQQDHDHRHSNGPEMQTSNGENHGALRDSKAPKSFSPDLQGDTLPHRRPSIHKRLSRGVSKVLSAGKDHCDDEGPCHGFSKPCGQDCFNNVFRKGNFRSSTSALRHPGIVRSTTQPTGLQPTIPTVDEDQPLSQSQDNALMPVPSAPATQHPTSESTISPKLATVNNSPNTYFHGYFCPSPNERSPLLRKSSYHSHLSDTTSHYPPPSTIHASHHHHVPTNPYLTLSMQTTLAIALHKLPEGFITYAANHASPRLGWTVFFSLFVHNISEGFAMALPLYLALHSRWKAVCWSSFLGGASQPLGAGVAALWFGIAGKIGGGEVNAGDGRGAQGGLIAVTAGIMTSVALQLFAQALDKSHNRTLCMVFAFVGMGILGISNALTA